MKKIIKTFGIIAMVAIIGCGFAACGGDDGPGGGDTLDGTWKAADGSEFKLNKGSFEYSENSKAIAKGTYTANDSSRKISGSISLAVKQIHGDIAKDALEGMDEKPSFKSGWYTKNEVIGEFRDWMKNDLGLNDSSISGLLDEMEMDFDDMFPAFEGTYSVDGNNTSLTIDGETYTKEGTTNGGNNNGGGSGNWKLVDSKMYRTNAIAYGNGKFVAVGRSSEIAYSADGINWNSVTNYPLGNWASGVEAIAWGNGRFVACTDGSQGYSTDGINWTKAEDVGKGKDGGECVVYNGSRFFIGGYSTILYSTDGISWTLKDVEEVLYGSINAIAWGNNMFVAHCSSRRVMATSPDGINWTKAVENIFGTYDVKGIAYGGNKFVAVGEYDSKMAYWQP